MARDLKNLKFKRVALVDKGANFDRETGDGAYIVLYKRELDSSSRGDLPDSAFAAVWTDASGNKQRKLPYKHADGSLDENHWRNALARYNQTDMPASVKAEAHRKLEAAGPKEKRMDFLEVIKRIVGLSKETDTTKRDSTADDILKDLNGMPPFGGGGTPMMPNGGTPQFGGGTPQPQAQPGAGGLHPDHKNQLMAQKDNLAKMISQYGAGPHPDGHPVHALKAMHDQMCKMCDSGMQTPMMSKKDDTEMDEQAIKTEVEKQVSAELKKRDDEIAKAAAENAELKKRLDTSDALLKSEIEKRDHTEMVTLLKSFKATPFNLDEKAEDNDIKKFQKMKAADPVGFARMVDLFKAAEAQIEQSNLLKNQLGSPRGGSVGSAEAQLQAKAEELVTKSANGISKEQAFEQACQQNPELVKQYRKEQQ